MLEEVRISGLGVIDDAVLELSPGFNVVTGETGAGKTMVVSGLGLLFGGRADPARVRPGADRASVEGRLRIDPDGEVANQVNNSGGDLDDDGATLVLQRSVSAEGRSRAFAGGRSVPVSLLLNLADELVAVHGQADQQQLLKPGRQRAALDRFAGPKFGRLLSDYQRAYQRHLKVRAELDEFTSLARERTAEAQDLRHGLGEVERLEPVDGEDLELAAEAERLTNADTLHSAATTAHEALQSDPSSGGPYDSPDVLMLLGAARQALEAAAPHDPALGALAVRLAEATYLVGDVAAELASYSDSIEADPGRLAVVQERRAELTRLIRLYGGGGALAGALAGAGDVGAGLAGVLAWAKTAAARLAELDGDGDAIASLEAQEAELAATVRELGGQLTALRQEAAATFETAVTAELVALAMPHSVLKAVVSPLREYGPHGADDVEIRLAAHEGAPALPLHKGASGGELSRVMLAIEVVFAGADPVPTFVFDEVDAGVGGKAAVEIGRRLARLARLAQVIVVTHLPQVAAFADTHLVVEKASDGSVVSSGVRRFDGDDRVRELSRMLAGLEDSEFGRAHATELLDAAAAERAGAGGPGGSAGPP
jgi:DNA repair protein RecN (Recombination protein N)